MIFAKKKKILVWCDDPPEDRVISIVAGCLANHDRAHSLFHFTVLFISGEKHTVNSCLL
jgi:hypothetical protein